MTGLERRWAQDVLSGFAAAPADEVDVGADATGSRPRLVPQPGEVDFLEAYEGMIHNGSFLSGIGMRVALAFAALSPLWLTGRLTRFGSLSGDDRAALLDRLLHHPVFLVAELTLLLKLCACMALFRSASLRARSNYDAKVEASSIEAPQTGGPRPEAPRLPVLQERQVTQ